MSLKWGSSVLGTTGGQVTWSFASTVGNAFYSFDRMITDLTYQNLVREAFQIWEDVADIDFVEVAPGSSAANISLGWDAIDGAYNIVGQASYSFTQRGALLDAEVRFDTGETWSATQGGSGVDFLAVAVHEIGHAIGLDHSDDQESIMYPTLGEQVHLDSVDILAVQALYGAPSGETTEPVPESWVPIASVPAGDFFSGSSAVDTVTFTGLRGDYAISLDGDVWTIVDQRRNAPDGVDRLVDVERLAFRDGVLALDIGPNEHAGMAYRLYQAAFDRSPDAGGLQFWIDRIDEGKDITSVAKDFLYSAEFRQTYGVNRSDADYIDTLYNNILHRDGEGGGVAFWTEQLRSGESTRAEVLVGFSESRENVQLTGAAIEDGIFLV